MAVEINIATLTKQVEEGKKKDELATIYGLSVLQMGKALKEAGLKIRKFHAPAFKLVREEEINTTQEVEFKKENTPTVTTEETDVDSPVIEEKVTEVPGDADDTNKVTWTT